MVLNSLVNVIDVQLNGYYKVCVGPQLGGVQSLSWGGTSRGLCC